MIISSIFVIQSGIGKNIFDLKEDIETQICSLELRYKLNEIIFRTLGSEFEKVYDVYFDYQQAVISISIVIYHKLMFRIILLQYTHIVNYFQVYSV